MSINTDFKCWMASFNLPMFFMISGFTYDIEKVRSADLKSYTAKLAKRILVPYLWLQMIGFLFRYMVNIFGKHKEVPVPTYLEGILVGNNNITNAPSNPLYSVLMLFLAYIGLWFLIRLTKGNKSAMGVALLVLVFITVSTRKVNLAWHLNGIPNVMLLIFFGRLLMDCYNMHKEKLLKLPVGAYLSLSLILILAGYLVNVRNGRISIHGNFFGGEFYFYFLSAVLSTVGFSLLAMKLPQSKLFEFIGMNTFFYLGIHKPLLLVMETVFSKYESHWVFLTLGSLAVFFGLAPVVAVVNRCFPYINGRPLQKSTPLIEVCKYLALCATWAVPYLYFNNHFMNGILREKTVLAVLSALMFLVAMAVFKKLLQKAAPFVFLEVKNEKP